MWPILGPLESNQTHRSIHFNHAQRSLNADKFPKDTIVPSSYQIYSNNQPSSSSPSIIPIKSNIRYIDPISSTCLLIYTLILLLLCVLPMFALNIYFRQAFDTSTRTNPLQIDH